MCVNRLFIGVNGILRRGAHRKRRVFGGEVTGHHLDRLVVTLRVVHADLTVRARGEEAEPVGGVHGARDAAAVLLVLVGCLGGGHVEDAQGTAVETDGQVRRVRVEGALRVGLEER